MEKRKEKVFEKHFNIILEKLDGSAVSALGDRGS
jgi:hypothetical protein